MNRRDFVKQSAAVGLTIGGSKYVAGVGRRADAAAPPPLRPPGAKPEDDFLATCIRCMRCGDACPNHCLTPIEPGDPHGRDGTPTMHLRAAACMLCMSEEGDYLKCTEACPSGALQLIKKDKDEIKQKVRIGIAEIDFDLCYSYNNWSCGACYRACPLAGEAMTIGAWERPTIHPDDCVGCGCCERSCIRYPHAVRVKPEVV